MVFRFSPQLSVFVFTNFLLFLSKYFLPFLFTYFAVVCSHFAPRLISWGCYSALVRGTVVFESSVSSFFSLKFSITIHMKYEITIMNKSVNQHIFKKTIHIHKIIGSQDFFHNINLDTNNDNSIYLYSSSYTVNKMLNAQTLT